MDCDSSRRILVGAAIKGEAMTQRFCHAYVVGVVAAVFLIVTLTVATTAQSIQTLPELLRSTHVHGLAVAQSDSGRLLIATHNGLHALHIETGIVVPVSESRDDFMGFTPHPFDVTVLYASGHPAGGGNLGFIISMDDGKTWEMLSPGFDGPTDFHQMDVSTFDSNVIYGAHHGLQASRDGGRTWQRVGPTPEGLIDLAASAVAADRLYSATRQGLFVSQDEGRSWQTAHSLPQPASLVETTADGTVYTFILGSGFLRAEEETLNWQSLNNEFGDRYLLHLAVDPQDDNRLFGSTQENELWVSLDGGRIWQLLGAP
jgi:photosystem II stability/assembly factor-like uncharacterized protein